MERAILNPDRDRSVLQRHPWIFSGAIRAVEGSPVKGATVAVFSAEKELLGFGSYSPDSQIRIRMLSFSPDEPVTDSMISGRVHKAWQMRIGLGYVSKGAGFRVINAESDQLPGLIVDCYDKYLVCQFLSAGAEYWKPVIVKALEELSSGGTILERSDADARAREGLDPSAGILAGSLPTGPVEIREGAARFLVDLGEGHKTGFYLDQRENRILTASYCAGKEVLNCFSYTGGFAIHALQAGARHVVNVESSEPAISLMQKNLELNGISGDRVENLHGDVFQVLRQFRDRGRQFDVVILDPPKFAETKATVSRAARGYKDVNLLAFKLLRAQGLLATFSCSGGISRELFQKIVSDAALDARRSACLIRALGAPADHAVSLAFPEGLYLKGLLCLLSD